MNNQTILYITTLVVYGGVDVIACLGLSIQFGVAGVVNFGFIIFQAAGAYTTAVLSLPSDKANGGFQQYIAGLHLPFPIPWIGAAIVGAVLAIPFTGLLSRRLRADNTAIAMLVTAVIANALITNYRPLLNGAAGLSLIPAPAASKIDPLSMRYQYVYCGVVILLAVAAFLFVRRVTESPYGRSLRAMRDNDLAAAAIGVNVRARRTMMLIVGGAIAGLSGGILVSYINVWAPAAWTYQETVVLIAALIVGGLGNHIGAVAGAILVPLGFEEATRYIPAFGPPGLVPALEWVLIGALILLFLWFRPQGVVPERRRVYRVRSSPIPAATPTPRRASLASDGPAHD